MYDIFYTEEEARKANWPCYMCEYEPAKRYAAIPPDTCRHCDKELLKREGNETTKPSGFESLKLFFIPSQPWGSRECITAWDCQKLRRERRERKRSKPEGLIKGFFRGVGRLLFLSGLIVLGLLIGFIFIVFWLTITTPLY